MKDSSKNGSGILSVLHALAHQQLSRFSFLFVTKLEAQIWRLVLLVGVQNQIQQKSFLKHHQKNAQSGHDGQPVFWFGGSDQNLTDRNPDWPIMSRHPIEDKWGRGIPPGKNLRRIFDPFFTTQGGGQRNRLGFVCGLLWPLSNGTWNGSIIFNFYGGRCARTGQVGRARADFHHLSCLL